MPNSVLVIGGTGRIGYQAVLALARDPRVQKIYVGGRNKDMGHTVVSNATLVGSLTGTFPKVEFIKMDLLDLSNTADLLKKIKPDMILQAATGISSFWYIPIIKKAIEEHGLKSYHPGHTVAKDLAMIYLLMTARSNAELTMPVVNLSFPDHTCYILGRAGLAPASGAGSIAMTVEGTRKAVADTLKVSLSNIQITLVAHHALRAFPPEEVPYFLKVRVGGEDITSQFKKDDLIRQAMNYTLVKIGNTAPMVGTSGVQNLLSIYNDDGRLGHAPGPQGLCGGYPVRFTSDGAIPWLPSEVSKEQAAQINLEGMKKDGIDRVDADGTVHFGSGPKKVLEDILKIDWPTMKPSESIDMMKDLINSYQQLADSQK